MANDDVLWKKVDEIRRQPGSSKATAPRTRAKGSTSLSTEKIQAKAKTGSGSGDDVERPASDDGRTPIDQATMPPRHHDTVTPDAIEMVRKAVKQIGKEAATHRFTREEKQAIADIVYTYARHGYRCTENEITRIAVNWLLQDYRNNGAESILHRVLAALNA